MGKASRTKRERREHPVPEPTSRRPFPVFWALVVLIVVGGALTLVLTATNESERAADKAAEGVPTYADVRVDGAPLPTWTGADSDPAIGTRLPRISGVDFDGMKLPLAPDDGVARVYVVVAHWCPHCRDEVPRIVEWATSNSLPDNVEVVAISTAASESQPNFPPASWLAREDWPWDALIDDELGSAAAALGTEGYPFLVFASSDGIVRERYSGEMPIDAFDAAVRRLSTTSPDTP